MSLTDALLFEAYRDPAEFWIVNRGPNGPAGSGTQDDPWNGATVPYDDVPVISISRSGIEATVITDGQHKFATGDYVTILGVEVPLGSTDVYYTGTFAVAVLTDTSFKYTMGYQFGYGAIPSTPSATGSSIRCMRERELFDTRVRNMPENCKIHLGPGVIETKGNSFTVITWEPKSGQSIVGSGMALTTLKIVGAATPESQTYGVGIHFYTYLHDFSISDLTIDCQSEGQIAKNVACAAVFVPGRNIQIRRVRAINWGSHTPAEHYLENYVIVTGATDPDLAHGYPAGDSYPAHAAQPGGNCVIEDCLAERPSPDTSHNSTILCQFAGFERQADGYQTVAPGCVIRNCFVNAAIIYGTTTPMPIKEISREGSTLTVTTKAPHLLSVPGNVVISGVTVDGKTYNLFNGVFEVAALDDDQPKTKFTVELSSAFPSDSPDLHGGFVGGPIPFPHSLTIESINWETLGSAPNITYRTTFTTRDPHCRTNINKVRVFGVTLSNNADSAAFNGNFQVIDYDPAYPRQVKFMLLQAPDEGVTSPADLRWGGALVNMYHQGMVADGGTAAVVEGNTILHCTIAGPYRDTFSSYDVQVRRNYYFDVIYGPFQHAQGGEVSTGLPIPLASLTYAGGSATAITSFNHGLAAGDLVSISGTRTSDGSSYFKRDVLIDSVDSTHRSFTVSGIPTLTDPGAKFGTSESVNTKPVGPQRRLESLTWETRDGKYIAMAEIHYDPPFAGPAHGFSVGEYVRVTKAGTATYNGIFRITAVPSDLRFEYELPDEPDLDSSDPDFSTGYFGRVWQLQRLTIESNVIWLGSRTLAPGSENWHPAGISLNGLNAFAPAYTLVSVLVRGNLIHTLNPGLTPMSKAIELLNGCLRAEIASNVISLDTATPIVHKGSGEIHTLFNLTSAGAQVLSVSIDDPPLRNSYDVGTEVEDSVFMALLRS